ncbi:MAG TPA: arylsulfotransferase family protein, partial [Candidatus Limnocylindria bacterium]|nr:arylsulfotransferase family protein [Candidatus Limnocylindria bacterium]
RPTSPDAAINLQRLEHRGAPVLAWWQGRIENGRGYGSYVLADEAYREIRRINAGDGLQADLHELVLTDAGTALLIAYRKQPTAAGASAKLPPQIYDSLVQEIDLDSGRVLFEWSAAQRIGLDESYEPLPDNGDAWDYCHVNSIDVDADGSLIVSARNTSAVYKVDRSSGEVIWRLGGRRSDFTLGSGAGFALQHDARRHADGSLSIFDDSQAPGLSRGIRLRLDESSMRASLLGEYVNPRRFTTPAQGNMQLLDDGHALIGWGSEPYLSEFGTDASLLLDIGFPSGDASYRVFRSTWTGRPTEPPALVVEADAGATNAYVSWNGATEVRCWELLGGASASSLGPLARAARTGFETRVALRGVPPAFVVARALDGSGGELGRSTVVATAQAPA